MHPASPKCLKRPLFWEDYPIIGHLELLESSSDFFFFFLPQSRPHSSVIWITLWTAKESVLLVCPSHGVRSWEDYFMGLYPQCPHMKTFRLPNCLPISLLCLSSLLCKCVCLGWGREGEVDMDSYITVDGQDRQATRMGTLQRMGLPRFLDIWGFTPFTATWDTS